jgi:hypothetical protein
VKHSDKDWIISHIRKTLARYWKSWLLQNQPHLPACMAVRGLVMGRLSSELSVIHYLPENNDL